mmetsp:Transcript_23801/g.35724  ORF Transcript_23801/g.35724 Transcript_23801/m.35724 type:complete len:252 (+) Transcript_23801:169-924(+)
MNIQRKHTKKQRKRKSKRSTTKSSQKQKQTQNVIIHLGGQTNRRRYKRRRTTGGGGSSSSSNNRFYSTLVPSQLNDMLTRNDIVNVIDSRMKHHIVGVKKTETRDRREYNLTKFNNTMKSSGGGTRAAASGTATPEKYDLPKVDETMSPALVALDLETKKRPGRPSRQEKQLSERLSKLSGLRRGKFDIIETNTAEVNASFHAHSASFNEANIHDTARVHNVLLSHGTLNASHGDFDELYGLNHHLVRALM